MVGLLRPREFRLPAPVQGGEILVREPDIGRGDILREKLDLRGSHGRLDQILSDFRDD